MKGRISHLHKKYQHIIMPVALVGGFILDIFTLNRIDQIFDNWKVPQNSDTFSTYVHHISAPLSLQIVTAPYPVQNVSFFDCNS